MKKESKKPYFGLISQVHRKGLSQRYLAKALGITQQSFSQKINRTDGKDFWFYQAKILSEILDLPLDKFE